MNEILSYISSKLPTLIAASTFIWAIISFIISKKNELAWKKTEFICAQSQYLDTDPTLSEMVLILEERHPSVSINDIFGNDSKLEKSIKNEYQQNFDKFLNFLWRLCYAYTDLKTLDKKELVSIGWYLRCISENILLFEYCSSNGYKRIIQSINELNLTK